MLTSEKLVEIKSDCLEMCVQAGTGHVTSALSCAEIVSILYYEIMRIDPHNPQWEDRDRFLMSKNHACVITYPILADQGFINKKDIFTFLQDGSIYGSHTKISIPGVDFAGGALGIGIGVACGMAYSAKRHKKNWVTFCVVGDGECYEGSVWEAAMFAGGHKLDQLVVLLDRNKMSYSNFTEKMLPLEPLAEKWRAFNWEVREIDGHSLEEIRAALSDVRCRKEKKPLCIIADTVKGHGIPFMENNIFAHGAAPQGDKAVLAAKAIRGEII